MMLWIRLADGRVVGGRYAGALLWSRVAWALQTLDIKNWWLE